MKSEGLPKVTKMLRTLSQGSKGAVSAAMGRVADGIATEANRSVRTKYTIKTADVAKTIKIKKRGDTQIDITARGKNLALPKFKVNVKAPRAKGEPTKKLKAAVKKGGGKKIAGAFVAKMKSGHLGVYTRVKGQKSKRNRNANGNYPSLPIDEHFGIGTPIMLNNKDVVKHIEDQAEERMIKRLDYEFGKILK